MKPIVLAAAGLAACLASSARARTWEITVDGLGDAPTVQAGIDSAAVGDTVLVHPGTYYEAIDFLGKDIVVKSSGGPASTTLDGTAAGGYVVSFQSGETRAATIEGFTITGGSSGVLIFNSAASVLDNLITANGPQFSGAGIWSGGEPAFAVRTFHPLIQGNTITHNTATRIGGGIGTWQRMAPEILDNIITDNEATDGDGGGIYFRALPDDDGAVIRGNVIANNYAGDHGGGFYFGNALSDPLGFEFSWNLVTNNRADGQAQTGDSGGGVWLAESKAWVHHNTIVANTGNGPASTYGGGIVIERPGTPVVEKNIIALTRAGGDIWCGGGATPTIRNNLAWQNVGGDGVGDCATWWQSDGNIVADPAFCDTTSGDFHLHQDSPAITHVAGPLGVYPIPGCGLVPVHAITWGRLKTRYQ